MSEKTMRGVFPILIMPFDEQSRVDEESLRRLVEFSIEAGVHGLGVAMGSEVFMLSEPERALVTRVISDQARGRVPTVINTSATGTQLAVHYSRQAEENGADALMLTSPIRIGMGTAAGPEGMREYFGAVSDAVSIPIFIQSHGSAPVSASLVRHLSEECENVRYLKEESGPTPVKVANAVREAGEQVVVFGGAGGGFFIEELRVGSQGTMPSCSQPEAFVEVWDLYHSGDEARARQVHRDVILRMNRLSGLAAGGFFHVNKEILRHRGVISHTVVRGPVVPMNDLARYELEALLAEFYPK